MNRTTFCRALGCGLFGLLLTAAPEASAQWVRIGPLGGVSIRVPFVSVDVSPWGDTRVRAPFTSVDAPGHRHHHHHHPYHAAVPLHDLPHYGFALPHEAYSAPYRPYGEAYRPYGEAYQPYGEAYQRYGEASRPYADASRTEEPYRAASPSAAEDANALPYSPYDADWYRSQANPTGSGSGSLAGDGAPQEPILTLRQSLLDAATRLSDALQRHSDGQVWQDYLQPEAIIAAASRVEATNAAPAASDLPQLRTLVDNYDGVLANRSLDWVAQLDGFDAAQQLLRQWVTADHGSVSPASEATERATPLQLDEPLQLDAPLPATQPLPAPEPLPSEELPAPLPDVEVGEAKQRFEA